MAGKWAGVVVVLGFGYGGLSLLSIASPWFVGQQAGFYFMKLTNEKTSVRWIVMPLVWAVLGFFLTLHCYKTLEYYDHAGKAGLSGFPKNERGEPVLTTPLQVIWPSFAMDAKTWTRYALTVGENDPVRHMNAKGEWVERGAQTRLRYVNIDNSAEGRSVYWNSTWALIMAKAGEIRAKWYGEPLPIATEQAARWQNLPVFWLIIGVFMFWVAQRAGVGAAVFTGFAMVGIPSFYEGFLPAYPDHHGLSTVGTFGVVLGAMFMGAGWWRAPAPGEPIGAQLLPTSPDVARKAAIFSALSGVFGMWATAAPALPPIAIVGTMGLFVSFFHGRSLANSGATFDPTVWRLWGRIGGIGSFIAYLLEFAPFNMGMRLEVNNPLYSIAFFAAGEYIAGTIELWQKDFKAELENARWKPEWFKDAPTARAVFDWVQQMVIIGAFMAAPWAFAAMKNKWKTAGWLLALPLVAVIPVPTLIAAFGTDVFVIRDKFLASLHEKIAEFQHVWEHNRLANPYIRATLFMYSALPLASLLIFLGFRRRRKPFLIFTCSIVGLYLVGGLFATWLPKAAGAILGWLPGIQVDILKASGAGAVTLPVAAVMAAFAAMALLVFGVAVLVIGLLRKEKPLILTGSVITGLYAVGGLLLALVPSAADPFLSMIPAFKERVVSAGVNLGEVSLWQILWGNVRWGLLEFTQFFLAMPLTPFDFSDASAWMMFAVSIVSVAGIVFCVFRFDWEAVDFVFNKDKAVITLVLVTTSIIVFMGLWQMRWLLNASGPQIAIFLFIAAALCSGRRNNLRWLFIVSLIGFFFVPKMVPSITRIYTQLERKSIERGDAAQALYRDVARAVRASKPEGDIVMLASPNASTEVGYYGRFKTIGTLYWENNAGLHTAAEMYSEENDDKALAMLQKHGVTHIVIISEENFLVPYYQLLHPSATQQDILRSLGIRLFVTKNFPIWVRPVPYQIPPDLRPLEFTVSIFEVVPNQTLPEAFYHLGVAQISLNQLKQAEESFDRVIQMAPNAVEPWIRKAEIQLMQGNVDGAQQLYEQAIVRFPEEIRSSQYNQAAALFYQRQAYLHAASLYKKALAQRFTVETAVNYAWLLSTNKNPLVRDGRTALELSKRALELAPNDPLALNARAAALAETGNFAEAAQLATRAAAIFRVGGNAGLADQTEARAAQYRQGQPVRE